MSNLLINAEQRIYDYLDSKVGGIGGNKGQWPRKTDNVDKQRPDDLAEWYVAITGEGDNINTMLAAGESPQSVAVSAEVKGRFADRIEALRFAGLLIESLPVEIANVAHFGPQDDQLPLITEAVLTVGDTGYELNGYMVELDCLAVIEKVQEPNIA